MVHLSKNYCVVRIGGSTSALLFYNEQSEFEVYIGNHDDIETEAFPLKSSGYQNNEKLIFHAREAGQFPKPEIPEGVKHYDIEEVMQGEKLTACIVRSVHESHGKLVPNAITFSIEPSLLNNEADYPQALRWITQRANAFSHILESEGMSKSSDFILNSFIYALETTERLQKFAQADRGKQTVTKAML